MVIKYMVAMVNGTLYDSADWKTSTGMGNGLAMVGSPDHGGGIGAGAASGGN